uniref:Uncharacterized protein n=1 Tax=Megaselia scalaris TaxID=36166 RepID=T1GQF9_MEGSC
MFIRKVFASLPSRTISSRFLSTQIKLQDEKVSTFLENLRQEFYGKRTNGDTGDLSRMRKLSELVNCVETRKVLIKNLEH